VQEAAAPHQAVLVVSGQQGAHLSALEAEEVQVDSEQEVQEASEYQEVPVVPETRVQGSEQEVLVVSGHREAAESQVALVDSEPKV